MGLRTPFFLTREMQASFYEKVCCDRSSPHRYWALRAEDRLFVGMAGLTNIQWENGLAEISLLIDPDRSGIGRVAVDLILSEAFEQMRLHTVFGECYEHNPAMGFWKKMVEHHDGFSTRLPGRKYWGGGYRWSYYFSFDAPTFYSRR
jgi:hypothetical protein